MPYNHELRIRFTKEQIEKVSQDAQKKGFHQVSQYVRWFILNKTTETEEQIYLIYTMLKENGKEK